MFSRLRVISCQWKDYSLRLIETCEVTLHRDSLQSNLIHRPQRHQWSHVTEAHAPTCSCVDTRPDWANTVWKKKKQFGKSWDNKYKIVGIKGDQSDLWKKMVVKSQSVKVCKAVYNVNYYNHTHIVWWVFNSISCFTLDVFFQSHSLALNTISEYVWTCSTLKAFIQCF